MSPVPTLQVRLRSRAYERPGSLQPNGCPSSGPEGPQSSGRCEELSKSCSPCALPNPGAGGGGWSHPGHILPRGGCNLRPQGLTHIGGGADCPSEPERQHHAGGLHPPTGAGDSRGAPCPWAPDPSTPAWEGPVGAMSQVERRPKARLAVESSF